MIRKEQDCIILGTIEGRLNEDSLKPEGSLNKFSCVMSRAASPSPERIEELWVVCGLYTERWNYAIGWCTVT